MEMLSSPSSVFLSPVSCSPPHLSIFRSNFAFPVLRSVPRLPKVVAALPPLSESGIHDFFDNHILSAVAVSAFVGQLLKPFTSALRGKGFNWKLVISSGGMPSVHSACVTATSTAIALERGLADSLFALSVVFAGIVMYDSQGVRRAVGKHAQVINTMILEGAPYASPAVKECDGTEPATEARFLEESLQPKTTLSVTYKKHSNDGGLSKSTYTRSGRLFRRMKQLDSIETEQAIPQEIEELDGWQHVPLKESVGHTKVEVLVGGLWGIVCTIVVSHLSHQIITMK